MPSVVPDVAASAAWANVTFDILIERRRQDAKHGQQLDLSDDQCLRFSVEEVGEVAKAIDDRMRAGGGAAFAGTEVYVELIQAAACLVKWAEIIRQRGGSDGR